MWAEIENKNKDCVFNGSYAGRDLYDNKVYNNITVYLESERNFVVTEKTNIKPVSYFVGREEELQDLRQIIEKGYKAVLVSGMGGIGKTHICRKLFEEYYVKHKKGEVEPFDHIGYIEYSNDMDSSLMKCLQYKEQNNPELNKEAAWKELNDLASGGKLLLFVDNVDKSMSEDVSLQRLETIPGAIILTSRYTAFSDQFELYPVGFLDIEQCKQIYTKIRFGSSEKTLSKEEIQELEYVILKLAGRHTITVEFLAHLAKTKSWSVKKLRKELEEKGFRLAFHKNGNIVNIQESYEKLYNLSNLTKAEQNIMEAFSIFPYIPLEAEICNQWLLSDAGASEDDDILMGLYQKGWLQFDMVQESYALHPVFAQFIFDRCKPKEENHCGLIEECQKSLEIPESGSALGCQKFIPFVTNVSEKLIGDNNIQQAECMSKIAYLLMSIEKYKKAEELYEKTLRERKRELGEEHPSIAICYNNLAGVYGREDDYKKVEELYEKALRVRERVLGEGHLSTIMNYFDLALVYAREGDYIKSEKICIKALEIRERVLREEYPDTATNYKNLAEVYEEESEYKKAEKLYEKPQRIREQVLGEEHLATTKICNDLARLYFRHGEYKRAIIWKRESYNILFLNFGQNLCKFFMKILNKLS